MRVGLIGAGKRMSTVYVPLLEKLQRSGILQLDIVGFTSRTNSTRDIFSLKHPTIKQFSARDTLVAEKPDILLICVNSHAIGQVLKTTLHHRIPILIETPIEDHTAVQAAVQSGLSVGVVEQWPFLPLEQFKEKVYGLGLVSRPFLVQNDCRSFDYHAIAQLRSYMGRQWMPIHVTGQRIDTRLNDFIDQNDNSVVTNDSWELGTVAFTGSRILMHQFSYACKTAPFRSIQTLRGYSVDGTVVTGRVLDRTNDYEIIDIQHLGGPLRNVTQKLDVTIERNDFELAPRSIKSEYVTWDNPFADIQLTDNEVAIASHIVAMENVVNGNGNPLYTIKDAFIDQQIMTAIKYACVNGGSVKLT
jgi:hypothetical protein